MLIFQPEPVASLQARFKASLNPVYTPEMIRTGQQKANEQRKHLFDFEDGTRLCISHEQLGQRLYLHCTGSMDRRCQIRTTNFANVCYVKLCELAGATISVFQTDNDQLSIHLLCEPIRDAIDQAPGQPAASPVST